MLDECLPMGCLSSRSTTVSPGVESGQARNGANSRVGGPTKQGMANGIEGGQLDTAGKKLTDGYRNGSELDRPKDNYSDSGTSKQKKIVGIGTSLDRQSDSFQSDGNGSKDFGELEDEEQDKIMTMLMNGHNPDKNPSQSNNGSEIERKSSHKTSITEEHEREGSLDEIESSENLPNETTRGREGVGRGDGAKAGANNTTDSVDHVAVAITTDKSIDGESGGSSFEEELNMDLLRQYIAVDFEISQLEDRDALRLYHEKIEQLEQLERELDMISFEAEEVAARSETGLSRGERSHLGGDAGLTGGQQRDTKMDIESNSIISGASGSLSAKSSIIRRQENQQQPNNDQKKVLATGTTTKMASNKQQQNNGSARGSEIQHGQLDKDQRYALSKDNNLSYTTVEEVFNRKIILEKERDKLKKEVEMVIVECDRLQHKYKKRDEILDKLFDGRTGNGLENHLEQQLNWLMEQKNYVDQVFYSWKRAETLTSQTCEQFANALELLKRLTKTQNEDKRNELSKGVCDLLVKSRNDMEQAQKYNPNVDAPFFTDAETERFDKIIETMQSSSTSQNDYNQMISVVQFAYKRAVSIRLWLEQILQITIARDSFELAEEYKWIAIQLRKERISLINLKLQDPPYRAMAQSIREQLASQHQRQLQLDSSRQLAITDGMTTTTAKNQQNEINRDSGIESDDIDIEEDIYRLLEMNRSRLEAAVAASREAGGAQAITLDSSGRPMRLTSGPSSTLTGGLTGHRQQQLSVAANSNRTSLVGSARSSQHDQIMQERIQRRARGEQPSALSQTAAGKRIGEPGSELDKREMDDISDVKMGGRGNLDASQPIQDGQITSGGIAQHDLVTQPGSGPSSTPSKLRIELDEESRRSLLRQVDQIHSKHRNKLENLRGNNKAKANDILSRLQSSKRQSKESEQNGASRN